MKRCAPLAVALILALLACAVAPTPAVAQAKDTLTVALVSHAPTLDPHMHFERVGILVNINMFDSLLHRSTKLQFEPSLATSWKAISPRTVSKWTGRAGSAMRGFSASTPASFSSADDADWNVLKNCEISCMGSKNIRRYSRNAASVPIVIWPCRTR